MNIRERTEAVEREIFSPYAFLSVDSKGRVRPEEPCEIRTPFQRDRDRIIHSKAFRRLKDKTQVFISAEDHYRVRLTHTLEVVQIARTIARALQLNEDLTEAIALGHDLGHTPFGHAGERALAAVAPCGFAHNEQSERVVRYIEKDGMGLNLTYEVIDGIRNHRSATTPGTREGAVVRLSDKIAYLNHDIDDAQRHGDLRPDDIPQICVEVLGTRRAQRIDTMIKDVVQHSGDGTIQMSDAVADATSQLREFLFETVYLADDKVEKEATMQTMVQRLFAHFMECEQSMPPEYECLAGLFGRDRGVCDYIAGMTDTFATRVYAEIFLERNL